MATNGVFSLSDLQWSLSNANGSIVVPGSLPSQVHLDLKRAGVITEPLLGINDISPFFESIQESPPDTTLLIFYGIDTIANITLADEPVAWVSNQFQQYVFDISPILSSAPSSGANLTLAFESAHLYGLNASTQPNAETFPETGDFEYPLSRPWVRKIQSDFGWDWGPAFVPAGVHKPAYFITLSSSGGAEDSLPPILVSETSVDIFKEGSEVVTGEPANETAPWVMNVTLGLHSPVEVGNATLTLSIPELNLTSDALPLGFIPAICNETLSTPVFLSVQWSIDDSVPARWWPHNLGSPKLYNLTLGLDLGTSAPTFQTTVGFRTIRLAQTRYPDEEITTRGITPGDQWHFEINGHAFYALGTNIIPFDPFYARVTDEQVRWVIESAVQSGQNMLRVWGGGAYQPSSTSAAITPVFPPHVTDTYSFYSVCDELGILAWSEFIFSDDLYPINDYLLASIETEVRQNVRRGNKHPSVAQWAGGNEIEGIVSVVNVSLPNGTHYLDEYVTLFQDFLHDVAYSETNSVPYTDCSTTHGVLSLDPLVVRFNNGTAGEIYGNGERYNYDASQAFNLNTFPVTRFMNEFGFHSMPSFYSWEEVLESPDDFSFNSTVVSSRDHHPPAGGLAFPNPNAPVGQAQMTSAVELWLPTPNTTDSNQTFAQWTYSTQVFQAMTMDAQIAWYRRGAGLGENNLGALVWQLNDIWQGVSWSSIEYDGRWKVLQYTLSGMFQPVIINAFWTPDNETIQLMVTSDRLEEVTGVAQWTWFDWSGAVLNSTTRDVVVPALNNSVIFNAQGLENILPAGSQTSDVWLHMNVTADVNGTMITNEHIVKFTPVSLADATLIDPEIQMTSSGNMTFTVSARGGVAAWTWLEHPFGTVGVFVDSATGLPLNAFYLVPGVDRTGKRHAHTCPFGAEEPLFREFRNLESQIVHLGRITPRK
ncbi:glycoside hydrolase [Vararia minispora EC-137]|uniref:Glycoside hydrolase n=1 Tax=Vararia minispora EC-137 TaxID=1314806 RepID=A0ACB8QFH1_9AGAM|nr:glycoside hydrolase [Vararia minispora EC-137]